jgi:hypothetical protein
MAYVIDIIGASEEIRTPDPQIRSLVVCFLIGGISPAPTRREICDFIVPECCPIFFGQVRTHFCFKLFIPLVGVQDLGIHFILGQLLLSSRLDFIDA